jgi:hypothetical protein
MKTLLTGVVFALAIFFTSRDVEEWAFRVR